MCKAASRCLLREAGSEGTVPSMINYSINLSSSVDRAFRGEAAARRACREVARLRVPTPRVVELELSATSSAVVRKGSAKMRFLAWGTPLGEPPSQPSRGIGHGPPFPAICRIR